MQNRQRFHLALNRGKPDRVPLFSEGMRDETLQIWRKQGLGRRSLSAMVKSDPYELIGPELDPIPYPEKWPGTISQLADLRKRLDPLDHRRLPLRWKHLYRSYALKDVVTFLCVHEGFFLSMGVGGWDRFERIMELILADPGFIHAQMEIYSDFASRMAGYILSHSVTDAVYFSEPIGGNDRPLLSPRMYREFVVRYYIPVIETVKKYGVRHIVFQTYGNVRRLLSLILEAGFNCLWACETNAPEMDYREIRETFGAELGLIGGIDLDVLRHGKEAIDRELDRKLPVLLNGGNYIPLADGRIRQDIPFESYLYYRNKLYNRIKKG